MTRLAFLLLSLVMVVACGSTEVTPVQPQVRCLDCERYDALLVGTELEVHVEWTSHCTREGPLPDTSSTSNCDEQPFVARASCAGADCEIEAGNDTQLQGEGTLLVKASGAGDVTLSVELEHVLTHELFHQDFPLLVRQPDTLVIDCWMNIDPQARNCTDQDGYKLCDVTWRSCPESFTLEKQGGNPLSLWVYAEAQGVPVYLHPQVTFDSFAADDHDLQYTPSHDRPDAVEEATRFSATLEVAGQYAIHASFGTLSTAFVVEAK